MNVANMPILQIKKLGKFNIYEWIGIILLSPLLIVFSLYSVNGHNWIWQDLGGIQKIFGILSGTSAFTGIIAVLLFSKKHSHAFLWAYTNAILFGLFALSVNLAGDFIVNIVFYIPAMVIVQFTRRRNKAITLNKNCLFTFVITGAILFTIFFFLNPQLNSLVGNIMSFSQFTYGNNFGIYWFARFLDSGVNSISLVAMAMMILGMKQGWYIWVIKNLLSIIFFAGVGALNISALIMNICYLTITIFIIFKKEKKSQSMRIAIIGPGAVGKTTVIKELKLFLEKNNIDIIDERPDNYLFQEYMKNMRLHAYDAQKRFFKKRFEQIKDLSLKEKGLIDRHMIDDFLFPHVHIKVGNFNKWQTFKWKFIENYYWNKLGNLPKIDLLFLIHLDYSEIKKRRENRAKTERQEELKQGNEKFFEEVNNEYGRYDGILSKAKNYFSHKNITLTNTDSKDTSKKIIEIITKDLFANFDEYKGGK